MPEPPREMLSYAPRAPAGVIDGRIVSVYGSAVVNAAQNQVVAINKGSRDGLERGHVLAIQKFGERMIDKTDANKAQMKLPDERNGLLMVFRTFDRISYALVLDITDGVKVGDRLILATWVEKLGRTSLVRATRILREDGTALTRASSRWALVDLASRRPTAIPDAVRAALLGAKG